ncbi:hypothetical protein [Azospirillum argentinense]|nr:hypothetical protein [Azospirillum argentinense]
MVRIELHIGSFSEDCFYAMGEMPFLDMKEPLGHQGGLSHAVARFSFETWEHFFGELKKVAPTFAAELRSMREAERRAFFDNPSGKAVLRILWRHTDFGMSCRG